MRILFVQQDVNLWGAPRSLLTLIDYLRNRSHICMVVMHRDCPVAAELKKQKIEYEIVPLRNWAYPENSRRIRRILSGLFSFGANVLYADRATRLVDRFQPDVVHTNSSRTQFGAILAWKMGLPHVWHFREFLGGPFTIGTVFSLGRPLSCRFIEASSSAVVVISRALRDYLGLRASRVPVHVVYNGVMARARMTETAVTPLPPTRELTLAWAGRFDAWKHPFAALEAMRILVGRHVAVRLLIAGSGAPSQSAAIERFVADHGLRDAVELHGFTSEMGRVYGRSHALVMSSTGDAFGRVTAEAMAYGRPVIGADACATSELVAHGTDGLLFRPCDPEDLAGQIMRLFEDRVLLARLGANAAAKAQRDFTIEQYGSRMERAFVSVLHPA